MNIASATTNNRLLLLLVCVLAGVLRIWMIGSNPAELFSDEAINLTSAQSVVRSGVDLHGRNLLFFSDRLEMRPPVYGYLALLSTTLLGQHPASVRLPAVLGGVLVVYCVVAIGAETFSIRVGLWAGFVSALAPWLIHYARIGWEPAAFLPFFLCGIVLWLRWARTQHSVFLSAALLSWLLAAYSYNSSIVPTVFFLLVLVAMYWKTIHWNLGVVLRYLAFVVLLLPIGYLLLTEPLMTTRAKSIFTFRDGVNQETLTTFARSYVQHFSPQFLFLSGDTNPRHSQGVGQLMLWMAPCIVLGLITLLRQENTRHTVFCVLWLLYYPLGGSLTHDGVPHATRTLLGAVLFCLLAGVGIDQFWRWITRRGVTLRTTLVVVCMMIVVGSTIRYLQVLYITYPGTSAAAWGYGNARVFRAVSEYADTAPAVCLGNLDYWSAPALLAYYDAPEHYRESVDDPACAVSGSIVVLPAHVDLPAAVQLRIVLGFFGEPLYQIWKVTSTTQTNHFDTLVPPRG